MLTSAVRITEDLAGLEKTLRLFQGLSTIAVGLAQTPHEIQIRSRAVSQFAVSRRFFRLLKWYSCWAKASEAMSPPPLPTTTVDSKAEIATKSAIETTLEVLKWSILGLYFFLEMFTITNAMGLTEHPLASRLQVEANKCWFYGLAVSILLSLYQLSFSPSSQTPQPSTTSGKIQDEKRPATVENVPANPLAITTANKSSALYEQIIIDAADLFLPGSALGWIPASTLVVGIAGTVSTTVAGGQIWRRMQVEQRQREERLLAEKTTTK